MKKHIRRVIQFVVEWLENEQNGSHHWQLQTANIADALNATNEITFSERRAEGIRQISPGDSKLRKILPYLQRMHNAMRERDRDTAVKVGKTALTVLK